MAVVCSAARGRAADWSIMSVCQFAMAYSLSMNIRMNSRWIPSEFNPADEPSRRFEPTRAPLLCGLAPRQDGSPDAAGCSAESLCDSLRKPASGEPATENYAYLVAKVGHVDNDFLVAKFGSTGEERQPAAIAESQGEEHDHGMSNGCAFNFAAPAWGRAPACDKARWAGPAQQCGRATGRGKLPLRSGRKEMRCRPFGISSEEFWAQRHRRQEAARQGYAHRRAAAAPPNPRGLGCTKAAAGPFSPCSREGPARNSKDVLEKLGAVGTAHAMVDLARADRGILGRGARGSGGDGLRPGLVLPSRGTAGVSAALGNAGSSRAPKTRIPSLSPFATRMAPPASAEVTSSSTLGVRGGGGTPAASAWAPCRGALLHRPLRVLPPAVRGPGAYRPAIIWPIKYTKGLSKFLTITIHAWELQTPAKTGEFDNSVQLDLRRQQWIVAYLRHVCLGRGVDQPVFRTSYRDLARCFARAVSLADLPAELTLYTLRHGGASHDARLEVRSLRDTQRRGHWRTWSSVHRYEKHGRLGITLQAIPESRLRHLSRQSDDVAGLFRRLWPLPSGVPGDRSAVSASRSLPALQDYRPLYSGTARHALLGTSPSASTSTSRNWT